MTRKILIISILFLFQIIAQNEGIDPDLPISGVINSIDGIYLIYNDGYIQVEQNDAYEEYYRKIYNDSTIVNPNTIIGGNLNFNIIPFLNLENGNYEKFNFDEPFTFGHFIQINDHNNFRITEFGHHILDSLKTSE